MERVQRHTKRQKPPREYIRNANSNGSQAISHLMVSKPKRLGCYHLRHSLILGGARQVTGMWDKCHEVSDLTVHPSNLQSLPKSIMLHGWRDSLPWHQAADCRGWPLVGRLDICSLDFKSTPDRAVRKLLPAQNPVFPVERLGPDRCGGLPKTVHRETLVRSPDPAHSPHQPSLVVARLGDDSQ